MGTLSLTLPTIGDPNSTEDVDTRNFLSGLQTDYNGNIDENNIKSTVLDKIGVSSATIRRGKMAQSAAENTASTTYTLLTTPDRVQNIVLPTDGLIVVAYQAIWQDTVAFNGSAAIFIGANQMKIASQLGVPVVVSTTSGGTANDDDPISTHGGGLQSGSGVGATTEVTTGQLVSTSTVAGGPCYIFAAAGTYDISVQFKNIAAGTVTVKNRHLWVWTMGF